MVNNDVPCYTLGEQHRMRPEIASLITPTIYPDLKNHISVYNRESVHGVTKDLFFLNHNVYETEVCWIYDCILLMKYIIYMTDLFEFLGWGNNKQE